MARRPSAQITRDQRQDGSVTFALRVRAGGADERVPLGNTTEGWDEVRAESARKQLLAKIELGLWSPGASSAAVGDEEPTFRELASDWLEDRRRNPAIRPRTVELNRSLLTRYLLPFFGELRASEITSAKIKQYRRQIHEENALIRAGHESGKPLRDARTRRPLRPLGNDSINKTLVTLAQVLDEAEDGGWIDRNPARGRRAREPLERHRHRRGALDPDELLSLLEAASQLDREPHSQRTLERGALVRDLRDFVGLEWKAIAKRLKIAPATAVYLYGCRVPDPDELVVGVRRAVIATLALAGPRVSELCGLDNQDVDLDKARLYIRDAKTEAGVRDVDIQGRLLSELKLYRAQAPATDLTAPAFPTRTGSRRVKDNVRGRIVEPVVSRANAIRAERGQPPIRVHVTPHTFRRTYITFMLAAGHEIPYVQAQVGHTDPTTTLGIYAQLIRRSDRDQLRAELRDLLETQLADAASTNEPVAAVTEEESLAIHSSARREALSRSQKAAKGRAVTL